MLHILIFDAFDGLLYSSKCPKQQCQSLACTSTSPYFIMCGTLFGGPKISMAGLKTAKSTCSYICGIYTLTLS